MALKIGDKAPSFTLSDDRGNKTTLKDFSGKTVVLYFYPKDMTTGCTAESCDFRDNLKKFKAKKVVVLGMSKDSVARHEKFRDKYELNFQLLSDESGEVCTKYGVYKEKSMYGRKFMGIERTTFIIDASGVITHIFPKVKVTGHVMNVLSAIS
ncbi:MAG: thioredoxin-dependent thiol peroxidase [Pseudomonadota bacterium]|nr:thioredoxin-dependent thiol peroxidase [Pseudomonadota bacterium]